MLGCRSCCKNFTPYTVQSWLHPTQWVFITDLIQFQRRYWLRLRLYLHLWLCTLGGCRLYLTFQKTFTLSWGLFHHWNLLNARTRHKQLWPRVSTRMPSITHNIPIMLVLNSRFQILFRSIQLKVITCCICNILDLVVSFTPYLKLHRPILQQFTLV